MAPLLAVEDLHAGYGSGSVLRGVTLEVRAGEVVSLLGRNGMGKTTTVRAIMGLLRPTRGTIRVRGIAQEGRPCHEVARAGIGLVPEGRQVFPNLSVEENLIATAAKRAARGRALDPAAACTRCFPSWPSGGVISARICRAASSRWWRSAAR